MDSKRFQISSGNVLYLRLLAALSGVCYLRNLPPVGDVGHGMVCKVQGGGATLYTTLPGDVLLRDADLSISN